MKQFKDGIFINQIKYTNGLLKKFNLDYSNDADTPVATSIRLTKDEVGNKVDEKIYRGMIDSLFYLTTSRILCLAFIFFLILKVVQRNHILKP